MPPAGLAHGKVNRVPSRLQLPLGNFKLEQPPLASGRRRPVQTGVVRESGQISDRTGCIAIQENRRGGSRRVAGQRDREERSRALGRLESDRPCSQRRLSKAPVRSRALANGVGQIRRALGDQRVLVRSAAVPEAQRLAVKVADLEDSRARRDLPSQRAQLGCVRLAHRHVVLQEGGGHVGELPAVRPCLQPVGAGAHVLKFEPALVVGLARVVVGGAHVQRRLVRVVVAQEDRCAGGWSAVGEDEPSGNGAARLVRFILEPFVGPCFELGGRTGGCVGFGSVVLFWPCQWIVGYTG